MKRNRNAPLFFSVCLLMLSAGIVGSTQSDPHCFADITTKLKQQDGQLLEALRSLNARVAQCELSDEEVDELLAAMHRIETTDSYQVRRPASKAGGERMVHANRIAAHDLKPVIAFQKTANQLKRLPLEKRVEEILSNLENPPARNGVSTGQFYFLELGRLGKEATPFILAYKAVRIRGSLIAHLARMHDERFVDYFIESLKIHENGNPSADALAARALEAYPSEKVVAALIEALEADVYFEVDKDLPQQPSSNHRPLLAKYYRLQFAASESLTKLTGRDFGPLFNEDYKTWRGWRDSRDNTAFQPWSVYRSESEMVQLLDKLIERFLSGRPNPWDSKNLLHEPSFVVAIARDLRRLGASAEKIFQDRCELRISETPRWEPRLRPWMGRIHSAED